MPEGYSNATGLPFVPPSRKGSKWSEEQRRKFLEAMKGKRPKNSLTWIGEKHPHWKGNKVGYFALHSWVQRNKKYPKFCGGCNKEKKLQWANKDHMYGRILEDYMALCSLCHEKYDKENNSKYKIRSKCMDMINRSSL